MQKNNSIKGLLVWKPGRHYKLHQKAATISVWVCASIHMRRVCFQELHITIQYVRYEKNHFNNNKQLLDFCRRYMTFKYKQWLNLSVQIFLSFSWTLLLKICHHERVERFKWIMSLANIEFLPWRKPVGFSEQ